MKNNYVKYGLLIFVALIWGKIINNYFGFFNPTDDLEYLPQEVVRPDKVVNSKSDYKLSLDYTDPFLSQNKPFVQVKTSSEGIDKKTILKKPKPTIIKESKVIYKGLVKNKNSSKKTGLLIIDGKSHLITNNNELGSIRIVEFDDLECKYYFNGEIKTVSK